MTDACATIVERDDPSLYATALFAPEPARSRLLVLYALDIELSRAAGASTEALIPRMRLQWWRDVVDNAAKSDADPAHEVAGPLSDLIRDGLAVPVLHALIDGYEIGLDPLNNLTDWSAWAAGRFGARTSLGCALLGPGPLVQEDTDAIGVVLGAGFALRTAIPLLQAGRRTYLPGSVADQSTMAAQQDLSPEPQAEIRSFAQSALRMLKDLRKARARIGRPSVPAFLPAMREERVLREVIRAPMVIFDDLDTGRPFDGLRLAWRAATGRW